MRVRRIENIVVNVAKIEEKDEKLTNQYRKDRKQLEDELEKSYQLRRKLDEEEGGNK